MLPCFGLCLPSILLLACLLARSITRTTETDILHVTRCNATQREAIKHRLHPRHVCLHVSSSSSSSSSGFLPELNEPRALEVSLARNSRSVSQTHQTAVTTVQAGEIILNLRNRITTTNLLIVFVSFAATMPKVPVGADGNGTRGACTSCA